MSEMFQSRTRTAAKPHRCDECRGPIEVGVRYVAWFQLFEGEAWSGHLCERCNDMRSEAWLAFDWCYDEGPSLGELRNELRDEYGIDDVDAWYAERVGAREAKAFQAALIHGAARALQVGA